MENLGFGTATIFWFFEKSQKPEILFCVLNVKPPNFKILVTSSNLKDSETKTDS